MGRIAVFPGSFDPITKGHEDLVLRAIPLFEKIVVAVGQNAHKKYLFDLDTREQWLRETFADHPSISVARFDDLTAHFCLGIGARFLVRGLRNASDFDYEKTISQVNHIIGEGLETVFLISHPAFSHVSSTIVREVIKGGGDATPFLPEVIHIPIQKYQEHSWEGRNGT